MRVKLIHRLAFAVVCTVSIGCATQKVRFLQPRGVVVDMGSSRHGTGDAGAGRLVQSPVIPFSQSLVVGRLYTVKLRFSDDLLISMGFTDAEIDEVHSRESAVIEGELRCPSQSRIPALFRLTDEQVRAVILEDKVIYWVYRDHKGTTILSFEGFPGS